VGAGSPDYWTPQAQLTRMPSTDLASNPNSNLYPANQYGNPFWGATSAAQASISPGRPADYWNPINQVSRMQRTQPVTDSADFRNLMSMMPESPNGYQHDLNMWNAQVNDWERGQMTPRTPIYGSGMNGPRQFHGYAGGGGLPTTKNQQAEMARWDRENQAYREGLLGAYQRAAGAVASRNTLAQHGEEANAALRAAAAEQGLQLAGYGRRQDIQHQEALLNNRLAGIREQGRNIDRFAQLGPDIGYGPAQQITGVGGGAGVTPAPGSAADTRMRAQQAQRFVQNGYGTEADYYNLFGQGPMPSDASIGRTMASRQLGSQLQPDTWSNWFEPPTTPGVPTGGPDSIEQPSHWARNLVSGLGLDAMGLPFAGKNDVVVPTTRGNEILRGGRIPGSPQQQLLMQMGGLGAPGQFGGAYANAPAPLPGAQVPAYARGGLSAPAPPPPEFAQENRRSRVQVTPYWQGGSL
jgi:hypothetical protein